MPFETILNAGRRLRRFGRTLRGTDLVAESEVACPCVHLGSEYGGWWIRPDWIHSDAVVISAGVGSDVTFDLEMIGRFGCTIHAFDPTPKSAEWVKQQPLPSQFRFYELGLANYDGEMLFALPGDHPDWDCYVATTPDAEVAKSAAHAARCQVRRLATVARLIDAPRIDVLKMDIEGSEFDVIDDMLSGDIRPRQVLVEYHYRHQFIGNLGRTSHSLDALRRAGYRIFARSPRGQEISMCLDP
jgi:FkbM family methyltransferase